MRYRLRTLLIFLALGPMLVGGLANLARQIDTARKQAQNKSCNNTLRQWTGALPRRIAKWP
jgi:hypothetical protein